MKVRRILAAMVCVILIGGCRGKEDRSKTIMITGSDTMINLASSWSERYRKIRPDISVQVTGGGTGVGINVLCSGEIDIATASRPMKPKETELATKNNGVAPKEITVGLDALAIFVHPDNPIEEISLKQLAALYGKDGEIENWKQLGVDYLGCASGQVMRFGRQTSSGTYVYFKEAVIGKGGKYKAYTSAKGGSSDIVRNISTNPCAIGYSGMGYANKSVKIVKVKKDADSAACAPSVETALDGSYPIARPLLLYTVGEPKGHVKDFIDWVLSPEGQAIVAEIGYVPLAAPSEDDRAEDDAADDGSASESGEEEAAATDVSADSAVRE